MITSYEQIKGIGGFPDVEDAVLEPFTGRAARRLKKIVGEAIYADAGAETPEDEDRAEDLKIVEAYLVLFYALPRLNMVWASGGGISHQGNVGDVHFKFLSPREINQQREIYMREIDSILADYFNTQFCQQINISESVEDLSAVPGQAGT